MFTCLGTDSQLQTDISGLLLPLAPSTKGGEKTKQQQKNTPMTLKSFYSHNHRLPSPWIRAVTPAPACLPPPLPNSQQAGRRGGCPVTAREGRGREGWWGGRGSMLPRSHSGGRDSERQTGRQTERERNASTSHQREADHCPHSSDMPTSRFTHTFPIQIHHSRSQILLDLQTYRKQTQTTPKF